MTDLAVSRRSASVILIMPRVLMVWGRLVVVQDVEDAREGRVEEGGEGERGERGPEQDGEELSHWWR